MSNKIVLLKNAIPDVMEQIARAPKNVRIYSPYLTSDVAETVIKAADQTTAQVFTTFKAETFATGGSSIETLRSVFESQFQIFSVPDLHAKIVITDYAILIGSQNLTRGGTKNREATAILTDADEIQALRDALKNWDKHKLLITKQMIDYMEREVAELKTLFLPFQKRANEIDDDIEHTFTPDLPPKIVYPKTAKYSEKVRVKLTDLSYKDNRGQRRSYSALKVIGRDQSLLRWNLDGKSIDLKKTHRYPLLSKDNGRISWVAFHNTQLTKFALGHSFGEGTILSPKNSDTGANLQIHFTKSDLQRFIEVDFIDNDYDDYDVDIDILFTLGETKIVKITENFYTLKTAKNLILNAVSKKPEETSSQEALSNNQDPKKYVYKIIVTKNGRDKVRDGRKRFWEKNSSRISYRLDDCIGSVRNLEFYELSELIWPYKFEDSEGQGNSQGEPPEKFLGDLGPVFDIQLIVGDEERETLVIEAVGQ